MLEFTVRKNGRHMATMDLRIHVGGQLICQVLAASDDVHEWMDGEVRLTKKQIEMAVRQGLMRYGAVHYYYWHEDRDEGDVTAARTYARDQITRHWPELAREIELNP